ncbi:MAG: universal stress protein, partial [Gemmatimonadales bacterium]
KGRTVLLAMDGSPAAIAGARLARALANAHGAVVRVLNVIDERAFPFPPALSLALASEDSDSDVASHPKQAEEVRSWLSAAVGDTTSWPVRVVIGTPASSIVEEAQRTDSALVIVGLRKHGRMDRTVGNETSLEVMRNASCPVLGVVQDATRLPSRILTATDFGATSLLAARAAGAVAGAEAVVVMAYVTPLTALVGDEGERVIHDLGVREAFARSAQDLSDGGASFDHVVLQRSARQTTAATLLQYATAMRIDLIAAGSARAGRIERWMMGSVSTDLVREGTHSVLIVPPVAPRQRD